MIRINLASARGTATSAPGLVFEGSSSDSGDVQKQGLLRIILIIMGPLALYAYQQTTLPDLISARAVKTGHLEEMRQYNVKMTRSVEEIKRFKDDERKIQARISYLDKLTKDRWREIKVLDLFQQVIPEKVWITKVQSGAGKMQISGMAMSDFEVSAFMEALSKSIYFVDVNLASSAETSFDGLTIKKFEIICMMEKPTS